MSEKVIIKRVSWFDCSDDISSIRREVFINEQGIPEEIEFDAEDSLASFVIAYFDEKPAGTGRILNNGHIGRIAVLESYRKLGIGKKVVSELIKIAADSGYSFVTVDSQVRVKEFYASLGFSDSGEVFFKAGIEHVRMKLDLKR